MKVRVLKARPGCVWRPGQVLDIADKQANQWIRRGFVEAYFNPADIKRIVNSGKYSITKYPLVGEDIVSIVIPVCDQPLYAKQCLESVKRHTKTPHEVIIIDNGSADVTRRILRDSGYRVIRNEKNEGFPKAVNQGILHARGKWICLLNSDTIVTPGWLAEMKAGLKGEAGIIGPTTNYSKGLQCDRSLMRAEEFRKHQRGQSEKTTESYALKLAEKYRGNSGKYGNVPELGGFCFMFDRRVVAQIGGFDTDFGLGNAEETDFEDRAHSLGWKSVWARGAYVHHYGHKTLNALMNEARTKALLAENRKRFEKKVKEREGGASPVVPLVKGTPVMFPTWERLGYTKKALPNLLATPRIEVLIYDDGSKDETRAYLESLSDPKIVARVYRDERQGLDNAIDLFFSVTAGAEWIAKVDNDAMVPPGWLDDLMYAANEANLDIIAPAHFRNPVAKRKYLSESKYANPGIYLNAHVGGLGLVRRTWIDAALQDGDTVHWKRYGKTPGGWTHLQEERGGRIAFYPKVFVELLDMGEHKDDYPVYNRRLRVERRKAYGRQPEAQ